MKYFAWIIDAGSFPYLKGSGGVSSSYILPAIQGAAHANDLAGTTLFILLRRRGADLIFARVHIAQVEQFEDGYYKGDFLLSVDLSKSFRIFSDIEEAKVDGASVTSRLSTGMTEIDQEAARTLEATALSGVSTNFRKPPETVLDRIPKTPTKGSVDSKAKRAIADVAASLALDEMWASSTPKRLPPLAHFSYMKIEHESGNVTADEMVAALSRFDPTKSSAIASIPNDNIRSAVYRSPLVDTMLTPIDVDKLYARRFVAREKTIDLADIAEKIEHAEKTHQDMLRDVASYLKTIGKIPLQSSSIDLFVESETADLLFEIKSATPSNVLNQSAKGAFQLFCYAAALRDEGRVVGAMGLILHRTESLELDEYASRVLTNMGVKPLFYDSKLAWPRRVEGLNQLFNFVPQSC